MKVTVSKARPSCRIDFMQTAPAEQIYREAAVKGIRATLSLLAFPCPCAVELWIAGNDEVLRLNHIHRNIAEPTDVLSFPAENIDPDNLSALSCKNGQVFLGSIVISAEKAFEQAAEYGHSPLREFAFLAAHSVLHLLGYDHEKSTEDEGVMMAWQKSVLRSLSLLSKKESL